MAFKLGICGIEAACPSLERLQRRSGGKRTEAVARLFAHAFLGGFECFEELFGRGTRQRGKLWKRAVLGGDAVDSAVLSAAVGKKECAVRGCSQGARAEGRVLGGE